MSKSFSVCSLGLAMGLALACNAPGGSEGGGGRGGTGGRGGSDSGGNTGGARSGSGGSGQSGGAGAKAGGGGSDSGNAGSGGNSGSAGSGTVGNAGSSGGGDSGNSGSSGSGGGGDGGNSGSSGGGSDAGAGGTGAAGVGGSGPGGPAAAGYTCDWGAPVFTALDPSTAPPGGLALENTPQFVSIGFDDDAFEDGMRWILDYMKTKKNPAGKGNPCTFDGTAARVSFFINSHVGITTDALKAQHARAWTDGHEVANHTDTHGDTLMQNMDVNVWLKEMTTCNDYIVSLGVPRSEILGFRTPFLQQAEATFQAMVQEKFHYDCSVEHFYGPMGFDWPYTLDKGKDATHSYMVKPSNDYPGLWELPVNELQLDTTGYSAVTGLDYNMFIVKLMSKQQALDVLKANLTIRMKGGLSPANRAPLLIGGHTDLYAHDNDNPDDHVGAPFDDRRAVIQEFIDYALAYDPAVRIVPYAQVLHWMQNPVGLDGTRGK